MGVSVVVSGWVRGEMVGVWVDRWGVQVGLVNG